MRIFYSILVALALGAVFAPPAWSHSVLEVEDNLSAKEEYFQPVESPAPDFTLEDADGKSVRMTDFRGKVVVLHFIYINCPDVCPLHAEKIAEIQALTNASPMKDRVRFVSVTTDPSRDRGEALREFGVAHGLDASNWTFLTTTADQPEDTTRTLAKQYGLEFTRTEDGEQMHGVVTLVIDQEGQLRARFHSLRFDPVNLLVFANALTNKDLQEHGHSDPGFWGWVGGIFN